MTNQSPKKEIKKLAVLSDLHLDRASDDAKKRLWDKLACIRYDAALIMGDITIAAQLQEHLAMISKACLPRPVYFMLGNHDYFDCSFADVDRLVAETSKRFPNLIPLGGGEIIRLTPNTALVAHRGWYDGQAGSGAMTWVDTPDRRRIDDFKGLSRPELFTKLKELGTESARYFRRILPSALRQYRTLYIATHVPPFWQGIRHGDASCDWNRQPYFSNIAAGNVIACIARNFPNRRIVVHAGHTHCPVHVRLSPNLEMHVAGSKRGFPTLQGVVQIE